MKTFKAMPAPRRTLSWPVDQNTAGSAEELFEASCSVTQTNEVAVISGILMKLVKSLVIGGTVTFLVTIERIPMVDVLSVSTPAAFLVLAP
ncbi:hypothetical protein [Pseudomonas chlororaphis]|uniref:hypothetical protein n=1 Tax=Pseudomonas chlororaphis TaxID=587753 RepID=UPI002D7911F0|nr:hypothetical protein [Pseudomonas chlororaphis]